MYRYLLTAFVLLTFLIPAWAQEKPQGTRVAELAASLGHTDLIAAARVDVARIDLPAALDWASDAIKESAEDKAQLQQAAQQPVQVMKAFREAGGRDVIVLVYQATVESGRLPADVVAIVTAAPGKAKGLAATMRLLIGEGAYETIVRGDTIVVGPRHRVQADEAPAKPSLLLAKALDASGAGTLQAALLLSDDYRRVIRETLPAAPAQFNHISGKEIADGFAWASLSLDLPPEPRLKLIVQATSEAAAQSFAKATKNWYEVAGPIEEIRAQIPKFDTIAPAPRRFF